MMYNRIGVRGVRRLRYCWYHILTYVSFVVGVESGVSGITLGRMLVAQFVPLLCDVQRQTVVYEALLEPLEACS